MNSERGLYRAVQVRGKYNASRVRAHPRSMTEYNTYSETAGHLIDQVPRSTTTEGECGRSVEAGVADANEALRDR